MGMVATNTIGQGDTRVRACCNRADGGVIIYADRYVRWPGDATVEVNLVAVGQMTDTIAGTRSCPTLTEELVPFISSWLDDLPESQPSHLAQNSGKAFIGDAVRGMGFIIDPEEAQDSSIESPQCGVIVPYLNGQDLNREPRTSPSRYVICFHDWTLEKAQTYPELLEILRERVKPDTRQGQGKARTEHWWLFARYARELTQGHGWIEPVIVRSRSATHMLDFRAKQL